MSFFGPELSKISDEKFMRLQMEDQLKKEAHQSESAVQSQKNADKRIQKISDENFKNWIGTEVKNIEIPVKNPIIVEENTKNFVNQLSIDQLTELKNKILNSKLPINERIFSNYALMMFDGENSNQSIYELIQQPIPDFKNVQAHSEDEVKRAQEYALKYMQIDELAKRSQGGDRLAFELLNQIAQNSLDAKIKNYAQRKFKEIQH